MRRSLISAHVLLLVALYACAPAVVRAREHLDSGHSGQVSLRLKQTSDGARPKVTMPRACAVDAPTPFVGADDRISTPAVATESASPHVPCKTPDRLRAPPAPLPL